MIVEQRLPPKACPKAFGVFIAVGAPTGNPTPIEILKSEKPVPNDR